MSLLTGEWVLRQPKWEGEHVKHSLIARLQAATLADGRRFVTKVRPLAGVGDCIAGYSITWEETA